MGPAEPSPVEIGRRARMIRRRRGLSLDTAAGLAGISKPYLSMLERGQRRFQRRGLLEDLAEALGCAVADLTGQPFLPPDRASANAAAALPAVSLALHECTLDDVPDQDARSVAELARRVREANRHADLVRYDAAGRELGDLLTELHVHAITGKGTSRQSALAALVEACVVAYGAARTLGHGELAITAARRGYDAARATERSELIGLATMCRTVALMRMGARRRADTLATAALAELEPVADPTAANTAPAEAAGMLHLAAAHLAARGGRAETARDHLSEVDELAERTGERNYLNFHFGPANAAAWRLSVGVELGDGPSAAEHVERHPIDPAALDSADRRAAVHYDAARGWAQAGGGRDADALRHLDAADRIAPQRIRNDPLAHELVMELDARAPRRSWELHSLRNRLGISGRSRSVN